LHWLDLTTPRVFTNLYVVRVSAREVLSVTARFSVTTSRVSPNP
jgi:hypothetical protein